MFLFANVGGEPLDLLEVRKLFPPSDVLSLLSVIFYFANYRRSLVCSLDDDVLPLLQLLQGIRLLSRDVLLDAG